MWCTYTCPSVLLRKNADRWKTTPAVKLGAALAHLHHIIVARLINEQKIKLVHARINLLNNIQIKQRKRR